jgi:hypothetical protein
MKPCRHPPLALQRLGHEPVSDKWFIWCGDCGSWKLGARGRWIKPSNGGGK